MLIAYLLQNKDSLSEEMKEKKEMKVCQKKN